MKLYRANSDSYDLIIDGVSGLIQNKVILFLNKEHLNNYGYFIHDFNHSMGKEVDCINISYAKEGLIDFLKDKDYDLDINFMFSILDATQYPYVLPVNELNIYQLLIRDCDLCQGFADSHI